jgi:HPt (histidine-containing phosphotransfer) domain-containing protein
VIAEALGRGDCAAIRQSAHALKGASANLRAAAATSAAARLEAAAAAEEAVGTIESAQTPALAEELMTEVREAMDYLRAKVG